MQSKHLTSEVTSHQGPRLSFPHAPHNRRVKTARSKEGLTKSNNIVQKNGQLIEPHDPPQTRTAASLSLPSRPTTAALARHIGYAHFSHSKCMAHATHRPPTTSPSLLQRHDQLSVRRAALVVIQCRLHLRQPLKHTVHHGSKGPLLQKPAHGP